MEILKKKMILWTSVSALMALVLIIWILSLKSYNFSESKNQVKELRGQVQETIQEINIPDLNSLGATSVPPQKPQLELPLEE